MTFKVGDRVETTGVQLDVPAGLRGWVVSIEHGCIGVCLDEPIGAGHSLGNKVPEQRGYWFNPEDLRHISYRTLTPGTKVVWRGPRVLASVVNPGDVGIVTLHPSPDSYAMVDWGPRRHISAALWELDLVGPPLPSIVSATARLQAITHQAQQLIEEQT